MSGKEREYQGQTDEALIGKLRGGQTEIMDYIMKKYKNLVRKRANAMFLIGGDTDDLIQEGMIGLFKAVQDYQGDREVSFYHFADLCITRQIYHAVEASRRKKHQPLNSYVSLHTQVDREGGGLMLDHLESFEDLNPERICLNRESAQMFREEIQAGLSGLERQVLQLYLQGMNYRQIAGCMEKDPKVIDNALQRIRGKITKKLRKNIDNFNGI